MLISIILAETRCPRCGADAEIEFEANLDGRGSLRTYRIGDVVDWSAYLTDVYRGRPDLGNLRAEAYAECPICGKDFFADLIVERDVITEIVPDRERPGHIP